MVGTRNERGQTMIQLALALVVLMGIGALAVDVGMGYLERRKMQNAADAGALAGAYALCKAQPADVAKAKAIEYMKKNGVKAADIAAGDVKISGGAVSVVAKASLATNLAAPLGFTTLDVGATAAATCGAAKSACGLWPIAFDRTLYVGATCGARMVIWAGDKDIANACVVNGVKKDFCSCYKCTDDKGKYEVITEISRGWLDFSSAADPLYPDQCKTSGCGSDELSCRIENGSSAPIFLPACVSSAQGVRSSLDKVINGRQGEIVKIPLFDGTCEAAGNCPGDGYHIVQFGCVTVESWQMNWEPIPVPGLVRPADAVKGKAIFVSKYCGGDCATSCGTTDGSLPQPWELKSVSLTK